MQFAVVVVDDDDFETGCFDCVESTFGAAAAADAVKQQMRESQPETEEMQSVAAAAVAIAVVEPVEASQQFVDLPAVVVVVTAALNDD